MPTKNPQKLLAQTRKEIAEFKADHPGLRRFPYPQRILVNIRTLSGEFSSSDLAKNLAISTSTIHKAKMTGKNEKKKPSKSVRFVEVMPTPIRSPAALSIDSGKVIMEFKTKSGVIISIFE